MTSIDKIFPKIKMGYIDDHWMTYFIGASQNTIDSKSWVKFILVHPEPINLDLSSKSIKGQDITRFP